MLGRRQGRPSLIGSAARTAGKTAVIVGTANAMTSRSAARAPQAAPQTASVAPPPVAPPPVAGGLTDEAIGRLKQLADLHAAGVLTDVEFAEQKARILNG